MGDIGEMSAVGDAGALTDSWAGSRSSNRTHNAVSSAGHVYATVAGAPATVPQTPPEARKHRPALHAVDASASGLLCATWWQRAGKRSMDIVGAMVAITLLSFLLMMTALAVCLTSRGPILYKQTRVGRDGKTFTLWKFRSMRKGAHQEKEQLLAENEREGPVFKIRHDPRVTRVGKTMRKYSLDELPQLFHVFAGKMSLVGPRPPLPEEVATYTPYQQRRLAAKPGLTCIWQTSGRSDVEFDRWVEMDIEYIETFSLLLDCKLLVKTVPAVLAGDGAY